MSDPSWHDRTAAAKSRGVSLLFLLLCAIFAVTAYLLATNRGGPIVVFELVLVGWIISLCLHEWGHAAVAFAGGDKSVVDKGYLTLDPLHYTNPTFSIILPLVLLAMGGIGFPGGAVYIDNGALRSPLWRSATSAAGPAMSFLCLIVIAAALRFVPEGDSLAPALAFLALLQATALVLNLLPLPGLDGFGAIEPFLPLKVRAVAAQAARFIGLVFLAAIFLLPQVFNAIWGAALTLCAALGVNPYHIVQGYELFRFWEGG